MQDERKLTLELANRLNGRVIISSEIIDSDFENEDIESLTTRIISFFENSKNASILNKESLLQIKRMKKEEKMPLQIEVLQTSDFKSVAKDTDAVYSIKSNVPDSAISSVSDFAAYFNDRLSKIKRILSERNNFGFLNKVESLSQYANGREVGIVGMVYSKITTKKGHILVTVEDETGDAKLLFLRPDKYSKKEAFDLFDSASKIVTDEVIAVRGKISSPFVIVNSILWPDLPVHQRKHTEEDVCFALISDIHIGSKLFQEKQFGKFLQWLNGGIDYKKDIASRVKYVIVAGDLVDGIGIYPNQERELSIPNIYKQYSIFFDFINNIPDYMHVFVLTGNHDAVQRAEPQPPLPSDLMGDFKKDNVHIIANPSYINLHGIKILAYHGTSLDSVIQNVPGCSYSKPETAMLEVVKRRHLSPIYGTNPIVPSKKDLLVVDEVPDIVHMGHLHKNGYAEYHGALLVNSGTWQARTDFQTKLGHLPTPAILPVYEAKTGNLLNVDFNFIA